MGPRTILPGGKLFSFQIDVVWDATHFKATACTVGDGWAADWACTLNDPPNKALIAASSLSSTARGGKIHVATVRLRVVATTKLAAPVGGEVKVMIREDNQPDGDTPGAISAGAGLVGLNGFDGAATTRRHMLTLRDSPYGTPGGIAEGLSDILRFQRRRAHRYRQHGENDIVSGASGERAGGGCGGGETEDEERGESRVGEGCGDGDGDGDGGWVDRGDRTSRASPHHGDDDVDDIAAEGGAVAEGATSSSSSSSEREGGARSQRQSSPHGGGRSRGRRRLRQVATSCAAPEGGAGGVLGDVDGDCEFNVKDVLEAQKYIARLPGYDTADLNAMDAFRRRQLDPTLDYLREDAKCSWEGQTPPCPTVADAQYLLYAAVRKYRFLARTATFKTHTHTHTHTRVLSFDSHLFHPP